MLTVRTLAPLPVHEWSYIARVSLDDHAPSPLAAAFALGLLAALALALSILLVV